MTPLSLVLSTSGKVLSQGVLLDEERGSK